MENPTMVCPECKTKIGEGTNYDVYEHGKQCLHWPGRGPDADYGMITQGDGRGDLNKERSLILLEAVLGK